MVAWPWWIWPAGVGGGVAVLGLFVLVFRVVSRLVFGSWDPSRDGEGDS